MLDSLEASLAQVCPEVLIPCIALATFPLLEYLTLLTWGSSPTRWVSTGQKPWQRSCNVQLIERWIPKWQLGRDAFLPPSKPPFWYTHVPTLWDLYLPEKLHSGYLYILGMIFTKMRFKPSINFVALQGYLILKKISPYRCWQNKIGALVHRQPSSQEMQSHTKLLYSCLLQT